MTRDPILEDVLGPLGAAIVREVAARGEASVGEIREYLRRTQRREHAYTTVMTGMTLLHERGILLRKRREWLPAALLAIGTLACHAIV